MQFEMISIEAHNACNLRCTICPFGLGKVDRIGRIKLETVRKVADLAVGWTDKISLAVMGEALLHPEIMDMIGYIKSKGISPLLWTNGMLMDRETSRKAIKAGLSKVIFSYEIIDRDLNESMRRGADYDRISRNLDDLLAVRGELGADTEVGVWSIIPEKDRSLHIPQEILDQYPDVEFYVSYAMDWHGAVDVETADLVELGEPKPCSQITRFLNVGFTGDVLCCCNDFNHEYKLGNIDEIDDLSEIVNSPARLELIERMQTGDLDGVRPCGTCKGPFVSVGSERLLIKNGRTVTGATASQATRAVSGRTANHG